MAKKFFTIASIALILIAAPAFAGEPCSDPVRTESGLVSGHDSQADAACMWRGIPYATPPVGELRWTLPVPAPDWEGVLDAATYGPICMQTPKKEGMSEDCLYINVWRPQKSGEFPVLLWIHGGGYIMGSGGAGGVGFGYDGSHLAANNDVVVVTFNYRLHALGFFADPALMKENGKNSTGSYGSLDQVRAIQWVHDNIAGFGGDPGNVTIFGESAGGWSVCTMYATPLNAGKIHGAIIHSGGCGKSASMEQGFAQAAEVARRVGCEPSDLECLRKVPAEKFIGGLGQLYREGMNWEPHYDNYLLTDSPLRMIRDGNYNKVPLIGGSNKNEVDAVLFFRKGLWWTPPFAYESTIRRKLEITKGEADNLVALYPRKEFGVMPRKGYGRMLTDNVLACPTYLGVSAAAEQQDKVWLYRFDFDDTKYGKYIGALHATDVPLTFGNLPEKFYGDNMGKARALSDAMQKYWANFAYHKDPNGPGLVEWPSFDNTGQERLILDNDIRAEKADLAERCEFWDSYYDSHRGQEEALGRKP